MSLHLSKLYLRRHAYESDFDEFNNEYVVCEVQTSSALYYKNSGGQVMLLKRSQVCCIFETLQVNESQGEAGCVEDASKGEKLVNFEFLYEGDFNDRQWN